MCLKILEFTMEDIAAQCTSFLLDGFETSGSVICLALYEVKKLVLKILVNC